MKLKPWIALPLFIVMALLLRWGTSFISVINHDESTYLVIARQLLDGKVYLRDFIDTKPIGVFWLYAGLIKLTGGSIPAIRLLTHVSVGLTAWLCFLAGRRATGNQHVGIAAGIAYLFATSLYTDYGIGPNSELFFNGLTVAALLLAVAPRVRQQTEDRPLWHWPAAGLSLGAAVMIKPFAVAESLGIGLFALWYYWAHRRETGRGLLAGTLLVVGFAVPLAIVFTYYLQLGMVEELLYYTFEVNGKYPVELAWYLRLKYMGDYLLRFAPWTILAGIALTAAVRKGTNRTWLYFLLGYFCLVTGMILIPGQRFGYYQVQLHPVLCLLAGAFLDPEVGLLAGVRRWLSRPYVVYGLIGIAGLLGLTHNFKYNKEIDRPRIIADYLRDKLGPDEQFFSITSHQISYYLLDKEPPTKMIHTVLLFEDRFISAFELDEVAEAERLLANPNLRYLIRHPGNETFFTPLTDRLFEEFTFVDSLDAQLFIYERIN